MFARLTALLLLGATRLVTGAQARWRGTAPSGEQRIYFANHQSHIDFVMIWAALPRALRRTTRPVAARDYWCASGVKRWLSGAVFNAVYVERGGAGAAAAATPTAGDAGHFAPAAADAPKSALAAAGVPYPALAAGSASHPAPLPDPLLPLDAALAAGESIILFPEGTRGGTGAPQPFKSGLYTLAERHPQAVLVPTWLHNIERVLPKGEVVPVPILCTVTFGAPIVLAPGEERRAFLARAREAVLALRDGTA